MNYSYGKAKKVMFLGIDGFDPVYAERLFDEGKLPNITKFMKNGTTTKDRGMIGAVPSYTPPNWCSMATGAWPGTHGITCYWNHTLGDPLDRLSLGFDSKKCHAEYIYDAFARQGKKTMVVGWPTTWPPTNDSTIVVDGSGVHPFMTETVDFERLYDYSTDRTELEFISHVANDNGADCFVTEDIGDLSFGVEDATETTTRDHDDHKGNADIVRGPIAAAHDWAQDVNDAKEAVLLLNAGLVRRYLLAKADANGQYGAVEIYKSKKDTTPIATIAQPDSWTDYIYDKILIGNVLKSVGYKVKLVRMATDGSSMRLYSTFLTDLDDPGHIYPAELKQKIYKKLGGPIMLSNCGHTELDRLKIVYEVNVEAFRWVMDAVDYLLETQEWDLALHGVHIIDISTHVHLNSISAGDDHPDVHREYIDKYYQLADEYVGRHLKWLDQGVAMILGSDHGGILMGDESVELGDAWKMNIGVMEELGYTVLKEGNGKKEIDWSKTRAVAQRSSYIYVNLKGRDPNGIVLPEEYDALVYKIIDDLYAYRDKKTHQRVINIALNRNDMELVHLGGDHVGDIFYTMEPYFAHDQGNSLPTAKREGTSIRCLFAMAGCGIKKDTILDRTVEMVDLVPTLCHLAGCDMPTTVEGGVIYQALEN